MKYSAYRASLAQRLSFAGAALAVAWILILVVL